MNLRILAPFWGQSGYERLTRNIAISLDKLGVHVQLIPYTDWNDEWCDLDFEDRMRLERMCRQVVNPTEPTLIAQFPNPARHELIKDSRLKICYTLFETDRCPNYWKETFKTVDWIWTFSEFNRKHWSEDGVPAEKLDVMPFGIDTELFSLDGEKAEIKNRRKFMFLTNGDFTERKNFEGLLEAFVTEFSDKDDVCLVIKTHYGGFTRPHKDACKAKLKEIINNFNPSNPPLVLFCGDKLADFDMPMLYRAADCYVTATRGEGLNLPACEALACGIPVIATNWSAHCDYINDSNGWLVPCKVGVIDDTEYIRKCLVALNHSWAYPDMTSLKSFMRYAYTFPNACREKGKQVRKDMETKTTQKMALWVVRKIMEAVAP